MACMIGDSEAEAVPDEATEFVRLRRLLPWES